MDDVEEIKVRSLPYIRNFVNSVVALALSGVAVLLWTRILLLQVGFAYIVPIVLLYMVFQAIGLYRLGTADLPVVPFVAGVLFTGGGVAFDMIATMIKTPNLQQEANPIARALLATGHPLPFVYVYGIIAQSMMVAVIAIMWAAFLTHRKTLVGPALVVAPESWKAFRQAIDGPPPASWKQRLSPIQIVRRLQSYRSIGLLAVIPMGTGIYRAHLGLAWFGLSSFSHNTLVIIASVILPVCAYFGWLFYLYLKARRAQLSVARHSESEALDE